MRLTLLGTGAAAGLPVYGCECDVCKNARGKPEFRRGPCSALLEFDGRQCLIDAGHHNLTESFPPGSLDSILLTHFHPDHVQGLFHLRWGENCHIPVYTPPDSQGCADLYKHPGILEFRSCKKFLSFSLGELRVTPVPLIHSKPTFGYCFEYGRKRFAYLTDTKGLPPATTDFLKSQALDLLVIDCTYSPDEMLPGHNNLHDVFDIDSKLCPSQIVLTHIGHDMDVWLTQDGCRLPSSYAVAKDGLEFAL